MADETNSELTPEQMAARIAELEARIAKGGGLWFKVSEKRAVSVYGFRLLSAWSNERTFYRIPTNCANSSRPTERTSRLRTKSRILNEVSGAQRKWRSFQVVLEIRSVCLSRCSFQME